MGELHQKIFKAFKEPYCGIGVIWSWLSPLISNDETFIRVDYYLGMKKKLNLNPPVSYSEKLQWLKLHAQNPEYSKMVDKVEAKDYVRSILGDDYVIPTLGVWNRIEDINFSQLPNQFVLKCSHDSGSSVICKDKASLDLRKARKRIRNKLQQNYFFAHREWPYKNIKPRIIAEKYMVDESGTQPKDFKFFCFDGEPKFMFIATDRPFDTRFDFFDMDFNHLPLIQGYPLATKKIDKPKSFDEMKEVARKLSKGIPHVRVDLYSINEEIYFGEFTFWHFSGNVPFKPEEWDYRFGQLLKLPALER